MKSSLTGFANCVLLPVRRTLTFYCAGRKKNDNNQHDPIQQQQQQQKNKQHFITPKSQSAERSSTRIVSHKKQPWKNNKMRIMTKSAAAMMIRVAVVLTHHLRVEDETARRKELKWEMFGFPWACQLCSLCCICLATRAYFRFPVSCAAA